MHFFLCTLCGCPPGLRGYSGFGKEYCGPNQARRYSARHRKISIPDPKPRKPEPRAEVTLPLPPVPCAYSRPLSYHVVNTDPKGSSTVGEFGDKFRKAREKRELSLDDVSNVTKINRRMLQAIEEENFDKLPGGVFNRGFIRAYAKHLGLNSEDAVNDYLACLRQAQIDSHNAWDAEKRRDPHEPLIPGPSVPRIFKPVTKVQPPATPASVEELPELQLPRIEHVRPPRKEYLTRPSAGIPWMRIAAAICLLMAVFFVWSRYTRGTRAAKATPIPAPASQSPALPAAAQPSKSPQTSPLPVTNAKAAAPSPIPSTLPAQPPLPTPQSVTNTPAPAPKVESSEDPNAVTVEKKGDVTVRSFGAAPPKPPERPAATKLTLVVRASENSWISITADGQLVSQETLIAPAATSFHATRELVVRVGNAAGVSFLWNGQELPPQGAEAEARTFIFDAQGVHAPAPQQTPP